VYDAQPPGTERAVGVQIGVLGAGLRAPAVISRARSPVSLAFVVGCMTAVNVAWLIRFRRGQVTDWDESGYMAIAIRDTRALHHGGLLSLVGEFERQNVQAPLLPLLTVPFNATFGNGVFQSLLALQIVVAALAATTFLLARTFLGSGWSLLAAGSLGSTPAVTDYSREYVFAVPAALFLTGSVLMLVRSEQLRRRSRVVGSGALAGLMLLSRTMSLSFLPALTAADLGLLLASKPGERGRRLRSLVWAAAAAFAVAGIWYLRNAISVAAYLINYGYGGRSAVFGKSHSIETWAYWAKDVRVIAQSLYLPLAVLVVAAILVGATECALSREAADSVLTSPMYVLSLVAVVGYLVLTSSKNEGNGFVVPLLPLLIILAIGAVARVRQRMIRIMFAALFVVVSLGNFAMKSSFVPLLGKPLATNIPGIGTVPILDGRSLIQLDVATAGYAAGSATSPIPPMHKRWLPTMQAMTSFAVGYASERGQAAYVLFATDDAIFNTTRATLSFALAGNSAARSSSFPVEAGDHVSDYRSRIANLKPNFVEVEQRNQVSGAAAITPSHVVLAIRSLNYRRVYRFRLPDGREAALWYRRQPTLNDLRATAAVPRR
jgi:4-amino-4-deoxy-L-arabinose transferase-like glycosyltransferase